MVGFQGQHNVSPEQRFWSKVNKTSDCWLWTAATSPPYGYGQFWDGSRQGYAHRFAYQLLVGPIPDGLTLDHKPTCLKKCVNPDHLRLATDKQQQENRSGAQRNSNTGVRGVHWCKRYKKFVVQVASGGKTHFGGSFDELEEAQVAAIVLRKRLHTHNDADSL